jgi:hypothetical protein
MTNRYLWIAIIPVLVLSACSGKEPAYREIKDRDLIIRFGRVVNSLDGPVTLKVRLIPSAEMLGQLDKQAKENLIYRMDSCFYSGSDKKTAYPEIVQYIATGSEKVYEYLVSFEDLPVSAAGATITYRDRYMNKKKYKLILQPQE